MASDELIGYFEELMDKFGAGGTDVPPVIDESDPGDVDVNQVPQDVDDTGDTEAGDTEESGDTEGFVSETSAVDPFDPYGVMSGTYDPYGYGSFYSWPYEAYYDPFGYGSVDFTSYDPANGPWGHGTADPSWTQDSSWTQDDPFGYGPVGPAGGTSFDLGSYGPLGSTGGLLMDVNATIADTHRFMEDIEADIAADHAANGGMSSSTASLLNWMNSIHAMSPEQLADYNRTIGAQIEGDNYVRGVGNEVSESEWERIQRIPEGHYFFVQPYPGDWYTFADVDYPVDPSQVTHHGHDIVSYDGNTYRMYADGTFHPADLNGNWT
jgi:hypothetical protein